MKKLTLLIFSACFMLINSKSQTIELTFTAVDSAQWVQLDSIKVMNRTQGSDTVLYWPDTALILYHVGIEENFHNPSTFQLHQNYPNPVIDRTNLKICTSEKDQVLIQVTDVLGRLMLSSEKMLDKGCHEFSFRPGNAEIYFLSVHCKGENQSIKILNSGGGENQNCAIEYLGIKGADGQMKSTPSIQNFSFTLGDDLLYIGYTDTLQSGMLDVPDESQVYTFQFAFNIPCPETPTVDYEGQTYNTVQIMSQCWLKENLNVGTMILGIDEMDDNDIIEKYCYDNEPDSCTKYGGLYQWDEMMQYTTQESAQGICPQGWHLPTDEEWKILEGGVDSQYGMGDPEWDLDFQYRGYNAGANLKTTSGWHEEGNGTDLFGFLALPGGWRGYNWYFDGLGGGGLWWSATEGSSYGAWFRGLGHDYDKVGRYYDYEENGFSVRCVRD